MQMILIKGVTKQFRDKYAEIQAIKEDRSSLKYFNYFKYKKYVKALNNVNLSVERGEIFGLLGPNGAGKTTLSKMIMGLLKPDKGTIKVFGKSADELDSVLDKINVTFARSNLFWELTARENLDFFAKLYSVKNRKRKVENWLKFIELEKKADQKLYTFSTGESMRVKIAKALINQPELVVLDEPTLGLDVNMALKVRDLIKNLNRKYKITVFITTHYMEEADYLCDKIAILDQGRIVRVGTPYKIKSVLQKNQVVEVEIANFSNKHLNIIKECKLVKDAEFIGNEEKIRIILKVGAKFEALLEFLQRGKIRITAIHIQEPSLADAFLYLTGKELSSDEII